VQVCRRWQHAKRADRADARDDVHFRKVLSFGALFVETTVSISADIGW
jgi:hypothetical protein